MRNMAYGFGAQALNMAIGFAGRTVFIHQLGVIYLGVNGLFANILSLLALAEMGVGNAILYNLYKPVAENDKAKISALIALLATIYRRVGITVAVVGLGILPLLESLIKDQANIVNLQLVYLLFLVNSVITYFFAHNSILLIAEQKRYVITKYAICFNLLQNSLQILILYMTHDFILYLCVQISCTFFNSYLVTKYVERVYPFIGKASGVLDKAVIYKNIRAMSMHKVATTVLYYTDNILITMFSGIYWVGIYANYTMILGIVTQFAGVLNSSLSASIGHLNAMESQGKSHQVFEASFLVNFWVNGVCLIALCLLLSPFITLWLGKEYVLDGSILGMILLNYYLLSMRAVVIMFKDSLGLFWNDRYKGLVESLINVTASIILGKMFGIIGVLVGTFTGMMLSCFWIEPYVLFKYGFKKSVWHHYIQYGIYTIALTGALFITEKACAYFPDDTVAGFFGKFFCCMLIPNLLFSICFFKTDAFKYVYGKVKALSKQTKDAERSGERESGY